MFACSACELLEGDGVFASIPLTALSSRSFCRGAKSDIVVVFTSVTEEEDLYSAKVTPSHLVPDHDASMILQDRIQQVAFINIYTPHPFSDPRFLRLSKP